MQSVPPLGILMLDTNFARPLGDAGNPASWPFPVVIERVPQAYATSVVTGTAIDSQQFLVSSKLARAKGAIGIVSTCGFLARVPREFWTITDAAVCPSTLFKFTELRRTLPEGKRLAILTIDASSLDARIRKNCDIPDDAIIASPARTSHFVRAILDESEPLDVARSQVEWVEVALATQRAHPEIGLWLFECANMPPYREAVERATGVRVYDVLHLGIELHAQAMMQRAHRDALSNSALANARHTPARAR